MNKEFRVHMLTEEGKGKASAIAKAFDDCLNTLFILRGGDVVESNRYFNIVKTKLEEACFFAKKDMAESNSEGEL